MQQKNERPRRNRTGYRNRNRLARGTWFHIARYFAPRGGEFNPREINHELDKAQSVKGIIPEDVQHSLGEKRTIAKKILAETRGSWGHKSMDQIDAELDLQRQEDWGE